MHLLPTGRPFCRGRERIALTMACTFAVDYPARTCASPDPDTIRTKHVKVLLLEKISAVAVAGFENAGFEVKQIGRALDENELIEELVSSQCHIVGIRSKTHVTAKVLTHPEVRLWAIGCFCIGTNQVDLNAAREVGVPVFNSPFCNSRSVAELIISEVIALSRRMCDNSAGMHNGVWNKSSKGCHEVRGKVMGIVGYGHIGSQLSVLAEQMGMRVQFFDILTVMPLGNSTKCDSLEELLGSSDFVTLHVPDTPATRLMVKEREIRLMKPGTFLLNASRGTVVDIDALAAALKDGHLAGAAVDVYPSEPKASFYEGWESALRGCPNTILTPHIGGSTEEAQMAIGSEVSGRLASFVTEAKTEGAVNFPEIVLPMDKERVSHRVLHIHKNVPGVMKKINQILADFNILSQSLRTQADTGFLVVDIDGEASEEVALNLQSLPETVLCRVLF